MFVKLIPALTVLAALVGGGATWNFVSSPAPESHAARPSGESCYPGSPTCCDACGTAACECCYEGSPCCGDDCCPDGAVCCSSKGCCAAKAADCCAGGECCDPPQDCCVTHGK